MNSNALPTVCLGEWDKCERADLRLTAEDRFLVNSLSEAGSDRLQVDDLRLGLRFRSKSWVGVVRFSQFEVRVMPKLAGGDLCLVELLEFTAGLDALRRYPSVRRLAADGAHMLDLLILLLVEECEKILRLGLRTDYVEEEDELPVVRGRLLADRQFLERFGRVDRVICRYDDRRQDVLDNQLLAFALSVGSKRASHPYVRRKARQLGHVFMCVCDPGGLDLRMARLDMFYDRLNSHYRTAHELTWLLLDALGISDVFSTGQYRVFSFLLDMNRLFEQFVLKLVQRLLDSRTFSVRHQHANRSIIRYAATNKPYKRVVPDVVVQGPSRAVRLVLDAKYKLYDTIRVSSADVYQAFLYAYAFGCESLATPVAGLAYPTTTQDSKYEELVVHSGGTLSDARIALIGLPIAAILDEQRKVGELGPGTESLQRYLSIIGCGIGGTSGLRVRDGEDGYGSCIGWRSPVQS
jgi:5-methylcytosine-specific restriction enzyme subunit McrC